ncbi:MAG TPA: DUF2330 domain-containing protein [Vicinamibacteria bacterium]|jgi:hypothetical protein|nr:DUF2330 domain-containing protein [Vicinamibacteria bacterium]
MRRLSICCLSFLLALPAAERAEAFCGFYVAKADTKLFNQASSVALVRDGDQTVMTMANDYQGALKEFAIVIPVPTFIKREQIEVTDRALLDHLDVYSSPRLVEYFDPDPCAPMQERGVVGGMMMMRSAPTPAAEKGLGVTVEARYTVGEYDILILSAQESGGLETWLKENGYKIPPGASAVLGSYIKQQMRFFVARVNLKEQAQLGFSYLRPLRVSYESPKFMLPVRLGTVNAKGPQELFVYALSRKGRVETTNYRTVKLPTGMDIPVFVKDEFGRFYKALFSDQVRREDMRAVLQEYAWDMSWCDPCAAQPLSREELKGLGVGWMAGAQGQVTPSRRPSMAGGAVDVFLTRLHVRYDASHFPEDLVFQETADRTNFQGRFVLRHPWLGGETCEAAKDYRRALVDRREKEAQTLASLTGWDINEIRGKTGNVAKISETTDRPSWRSLFSPF